MKKEILNILSDSELVLFFNQIEIDWVANAECMKELFCEFDELMKVDNKLCKTVKFNESIYNQVYIPTMEFEYQAKDIKYIVCVLSRERCTIRTRNRDFRLDSNVVKQFYTIWNDGNRINLSYSDILYIIRCCKKHSFEEIKQLLAFA